MFLLTNTYKIFSQDGYKLLWHFEIQMYISQMDGLVQERCNSIATALKLHFFVITNWNNFQLNWLNWDDFKSIVVIFVSWNSIVMIRMIRINMDLGIANSNINKLMHFSKQCRGPDMNNDFLQVHFFYCFECTIFYCLHIFVLPGLILCLPFWFCIYTYK